MKPSRAGAGDRAMIRQWAARLGAFRPKAKSHIALVGLMAGALHALDRAAKLNFDDSRMNPDPATFADEFRTVLRAISKGRPVSNAWLAGFYIHSAMFRLAPVNHRLNKLLNEEDDSARLVRLAVNSLKHDIAAHISGKKTVPFKEVLWVAGVICGRLERALRDGKR